MGRYDVCRHVFEKVAIVFSESLSVVFPGRYLFSIQTRIRRRQHMVWLSFLGYWVIRRLTDVSTYFRILKFRKHFEELTIILFFCYLSANLCVTCSWTSFRQSEIAEPWIIFSVDFLENSRLIIGSIRYSNTLWWIQRRNERSLQRCH